MMQHLYEDIPLVPRLNENYLDMSVAIGRVGAIKNCATPITTREDGLVELHCNGKLWAFGELHVQADNHAQVTIVSLV